MTKKKIIRFIILCLVYLLIFMLFLGNKKKYNINFAVVPHFTIQEQVVHRQYKNIQDAYQLSGKKINILIISPDHFYTLKNNNLKLNNLNKDMCYKDTCLNVKGVYEGNGRKYKKYIKEHGLGEHFPYIKKYFPDSNLYLAKIKGRDFGRIDTILEEFKKLEKKGDLLVLASVDFSHYVNEDWANLHDIKTRYVMQNSLDKDDYKNIEVDCPTCLYLTNLWASEKNQFPNFVFRDSSSVINNKDLGYDNTSRQWYLYGDEKENNNGITIGFFGSSLSDLLSLNNEELVNHMRDFYQLGNIKNNPKYNVHRKGFGIDFLGFTLENSYSGLSSKLKTLSELGFNIINLDLLKNIELNNKYDYFGNKGISKNIVLEKNIRGIKIAFHGYDFRNRENEDCKNLENYKSSGYINVVSVHGKEKINLLEDLIDCGADVILIEQKDLSKNVDNNIQWYKDKLIIFIARNKYVLIDIDQNGLINNLIK
ncbi:MAG: hypothetical protein M0P94_02850 [Candidatus Absconditabacterales bacterium]|nr:hypothetical protein [Candidatus Absconditabacterales bacterium]